MMAMVSTGAPQDEARGCKKKIMAYASEMLLVYTSTSLDAVCSAYEATRLVRTPIASMSVPVSIPYSVMAVPHPPYTAPATVSDTPNSSERSMVNTSLRAKYP